MPPPSLPSVSPRTTHTGMTNAAVIPASHASERLEMLPGVDPRVVGHQLRTVGVVECQNRGLAENVDRPQARGMGRIAFEIDRTPMWLLTSTPHA